MKYKPLKIIGLMSGTSMDGIDISLVKTNGIQLERLNENHFYEYNTETKKKLISILKKDVNFNLNRKKYLDKFITNEHYLALKNLNFVKDVDLIGFHGQTIYHNAKIRTSIQLGDPKLLATKLKKSVVFNFRSNDLAFGGQGAPLAPIYHKFLIENHNLMLPSCVLNIGGVSNLTYWDSKNLIGFDTGPGNALMDDYMSTISNSNFDKDGTLASQGVPIRKIVNEILENEFFKRPPPKSLDRLSFEENFKKILQNKISIYDTMATLLEFTVESIVLGFNLLPNKVKSILVTGGGYRNTHLMNRLKERLKIKIFNENQLGINFDYIEAELIAYLSARSFYNLPFTFPYTTGVSKPLSGGDLYKYL